jgi:ABC-2 type transport system permease protein
MQGSLLPAWIGSVAKFNPVNWAAEAGRSAAMQKTDWGLVGTRMGLLAVLVVASALLASSAFAKYQRSL